MRKGTAATAALLLPLGLVLAASPAQGDDTMVLHSQMKPLNSSGSTGTATVEVKGTSVTVDIESSGFAPPELPHAQHFHIGEQNMCPPDDPDQIDEDGDGFISTSDGLPFYGPIAASLTTEGSTSPEDGLDLDIMPVADADGNISYHRAFEVDDEVAQQLRNEEAVIVQHGIDPNNNGEYDFDGAGESDLDPEVPAEATHPATCGELVAAPENGVDAGFGGAAGSDNSAAGLIGLGAGLLAAAGVAALAGRRLLGSKA